MIPIFLVKGAARGRGDALKTFVLPCDNMFKFSLMVCGLVTVHGYFQLIVYNRVMIYPHLTLQMEKTVEIDDNQKVVKDLKRLGELVPPRPFMALNPMEVRQWLYRWTVAGWERWIFPWAQETFWANLGSS